MRKLGIALSVAFLAAATIGVGAGAYYTTLYFNRDKNKRFEAAYLYDTTFSEAVDVDLGVIYPGEPLTQTILVVSLLNKDIMVVFSFGTTSEEKFDYISVTFNYETEPCTLEEYIAYGKQYSTKFKSQEARSIDITYVLKADVDLPPSHSIDFSIFIKAYDIGYE